jgi:Xaa-Pro aminopeptidase
MLTEAGCRSRRRRLWDRVPPEVEWLLVADPRHVHYLSNFWVHPLSFSGGERGLLLLERDAGATLIGDNFSLRSAAGLPHVDREVIERWYDHQHSVGNRDHALVAALAQVAPKLAGRLGLVEAQWLPLDAWQVLARESESQNIVRGTDDAAALPAADVGSLLRTLRREKEADELALLRECMQATDAGHLRAREVVRAGVSEFEIYLEVQRAALEAAGRPALVYGDFRATTASRPKAGGLPTDYRLQAGDLFILDYSVVIDGYRSDFTNTLAVGAPSDEQQLLFGVCQSAMQAGEQALCGGAAARDVYAAVSRPMEQSGYGALRHHAGHGIGLAHPEPPILVPHSDDVLVPGDVITLEPGLYIEGIGGIRIENNYLITSAGWAKLSDHLISLT